MSHDLKSPLTSIRAYTEGLLDGVAKDEAARTHYLQTIYAKETELETLVNRLFAFAKLDLNEAPAEPETLHLSETLSDIVDGYDAEGLDVQLDDLPDGKVLADRALLSRSISICSTTAANTARVTLRFLRISLTIPFLFPFRMKAPAWRDRSLRKFLSLATAPIPRGRIPQAAAASALP